MIINLQGKRVIYKGIATIILLIFTFIVITPFIWMAMMSLRTTGEILDSPYGFPKVIRWQNYVNLMGSQIRFYRYIFNSVIVTVGSLILTLILSCLGGYGFGRKRYAFKFRDMIFLILLFSLMLPRQATYIPQFMMMYKYELLNKRTGLILLYSAYALSVSTYLMKTYFSQIPEELEDAARIDGASDFRIFFEIMLPLAKPVVITVIIINSLYFWNELLIALTMISEPEMRTLPLAMMNFVSEHGSDYGMAAASLVVGMLPLVILYLISAKRFLQETIAGAIKG